MIIREAATSDAAAIARVHVDTWRATYRGIVPDDPLAKLSYEEQAREWEGILCAAERFTYVAEDTSGRVVAYATGGPEAGGDPIYNGELFRLYILGSHQHRGLGRRLIRQVAARLRRNGSTSMLTWVMARGAARAFYEHLGGRYLRTGSWNHGGLTIDEVAYGWPDTAVLEMTP